jgi:hypothetical protein
VRWSYDTRRGIRLATIAFVLAPHFAVAQATSVQEPPPSGLVDEFTRLFGIHYAIGDLKTLSLPDSALEFRFWSIGWGINGLRLQRTASGEWLAQRIVINGPNSARIDSLPLAIAGDAQRMDSMWDELVREGVHSLPTHVPRTWMMMDGHSYIYELRRGQSYRAVWIEHVAKPEAPADDAIKRIARILQAHFPFLRVPSR